MNVMGSCCFSRQCYWKGKTQLTRVVLEYLLQCKQNDSFKGTDLKHALLHSKVCFCSILKQYFCRLHKSSTQNVKSARISINLPNATSCLQTKDKFASCSIFFFNFPPFYSEVLIFILKSFLRHYALAGNVKGFAYSGFSFMASF